MNTRFACVLAFALSLATGVCAMEDKPLLHGEFIFPLDGLHNHGSCVVETPGGDLLVCWYNGSGERQADDCRILGARLHHGAGVWSRPFVMADTTGFPDTNSCMCIEPSGRLWLIWPTILANLWESALLKYKVADDWLGDGVPKWKQQEVLHLKPGPEFAAAVAQAVAKRHPETADNKTRAYLDDVLAAANDKLKSRLGWMTRAHPVVLDGPRLIVPLYSDGFDFSLMAITDDWGQTWHTSTPLIGEGNVQPSIARRKDGSLYAMMRDNGPPPHRIQQASSYDRGETWTAVTDSSLPDPGAGLEVITLRDGRWLLINNDTEKGRHSLCARLSDDEGRTWKWQRHLEREAPGPDAGSYSYPSVIEANDGTFHATYSYAISKSKAAKDAEGRPARETIKHVRFNVAWIQAGGE